MIVRLGIRRGTGDELVVLEADENADTSSLALSLGLPPGSLLRIDPSGRTAPIPPGAIGASGILDGDVVAGNAAATPPVPTAVSVDQKTVPSPWSLQVVEGPDTGSVFVVALGETSIGRSSDCDLKLRDDEVSRKHAVLDTKRGTIAIADASSANGTFVDGAAISARQRLRAGQRIALGKTVLVVVGSVDTVEGPAAHEPTGEASCAPDHRGNLLLNRIPSLRSDYRPGEVTFPEAGRPRDKRSPQWLPSLLPVAFAAGIAIWQQQMMFLLFALLGPVTLGASAISARYADKRDAKRDKAALEAETAAARAALSVAVAEESTWLRASAPSGLDVAEIAIGRGSRLWERSPQDVDFLQVRLGEGNETARVLVRSGSNYASPVELSDVPLVANLASAGVIGIAGPRAARQGVARSVLVQIAGLHAADEVRIALLAEHAPEHDWGMFRWLPHSWSADERRLDVAQGSEEINDLVSRLLKIVAERQLTRWDTQTSRESVHVVVLEGVAGLRKRPAVAELLASGPRYGVYAIVLDDEPRLLPEECRVRATVNGAAVTIESVADRTVRAGRADLLDADRALRAARSLAPIRRVGGLETSSTSLPARVTFFEALGERPTISSMTRRWSERSTTSVPVGVDAAGALRIDLVGSGPHALVAGTSGMGKSEFIQTWVTSLAVHNRPDDLAFLFVEYKGLSAFLGLQHLPHCVGTITNLSAELTSRALASLNAEKLRRQNLFATAEAADFPAYQRARSSRPDLEPMPRLVIVLDEFAELKQNLPEFIDGLVSIARTGRSLGIHLVLATQQISRAVSPEISGNATLRVSLRAQTPEDSFAVLDSKIANDLPLAIKGRAYVRRGELSPELFQCAWSGAPVDSTERSVLTAHPWPWRSDELRYQTVHGAPSVPVTEMDDVVEVMKDTCAQMGIVRPRRPFTEPLRTAIPLDDLAAREPVVGLNDLVRLGGPVIGERDDLARQLHEPYAVPLLRGHVGVIGSNQSGRTTVVRTTISSWARSMPPSMFHVHAIDSGRGLAAVAALPHAGTVTPADGPRAGRLLGLLAAEVNRRLARLEEQSMGDLVEMWAHTSQDDPVPWILLVIDRFEDLVAAVENSPAEQALEKILSHGVAAGVTVLAAGDDTLTRMRWLQRFSTRLMLRNTGGLDPISVGLPARTPFVGLENGRCYESVTGSLVQVGYDGTSAAVADQNQALREHGEELAARWANLRGVPPLRLRDLPDHVEAAALPAATTEHGVVIGLGGDAAEPIEIDRERLPLLVVSADGAGRTEVLARFASQWLAAGLAVIVAGPPGSSLVRDAPPGARVVSREGEIDWSAVLADPGAAVVVDDLHASTLPDDLVGALEAAVPNSLFAGGCAGMTMVPSPLAAIVRSGTLLYLTPSDARVVDYFGVRVDPGLCAAQPRGRSVVVNGRRQSSIQVAISAD